MQLCVFVIIVFQLLLLLLLTVVAVAPLSLLLLTIVSDNILSTLRVALLVWRYLSNAASSALCAVYSVKDHHTLQAYSSLLKKHCVRQVGLDKWFPLNEVSWWAAPWRRSVGGLKRALLKLLEGPLGPLEDHCQHKGTLLKLLSWGAAPSRRRGGGR